MNEAFKALQARFIDRCRSDLELLTSGGDVSELRMLVHRLAGAAGVFGFADISDLAGRLEGQAQDGAAFDPTDMAALQAALRNLVDAH